MLSLNRQLRRPGLARKRLIAVAAALCAWLGASSPARAEQDIIGIPVLRFAVGPALSNEPARGDDAEVAFDVTAGFVGILGDDSAGFVFNPELGYAYDSFGVDAFNATCGVGFGGPIAAILYQPRLILGSAADGDFAIGMRNGISLRAFVDILSLEVAHQMVYANDVTQTDIRILFGFNVGAFSYLITEASSAFR